MGSLVSIIVPCYNLEQYILSCLESIAKLKYKPLEVIIVDDGSKDKSFSIVSNFIKNNNAGGGQSFRLIHQENAGAAAARNTGLLTAKGKYIAFIDGDDTVDPEYISNMVQGLESSDVDLCVSGVRGMDEQGAKKKDFRLKEDTIFGKNDILLKIDEQDFVLCNLYCKLYKASIINDYQLRLDSRLKVGEDLSFNLDYITCTNSISIIDDCGYNYRLRGNSLIHSVTLPTKQKYVLEHFQNLFTQFPIDVVKEVLDKNKKFQQLFWNHGVLNYVQAQIMEKNRYDSIYDSVPFCCLIEICHPESAKDKLFYYGLRYKFGFLLKAIVFIKYTVLLKNKKFYDVIKKKAAS